MPLDPVGGSKCPQTTLQKVEAYYSFLLRAYGYVAHLVTILFMLIMAPTSESYPSTLMYICLRPAKSPAFRGRLPHFGGKYFTLHNAIFYFGLLNFNFYEISPLWI